MFMRNVDDSMPRLLLAVGLSLLLHTALVISVGRPAGGEGGSGAAVQAPPLIARLAAAVTDTVTSVPVMPDPVAAPAAELDMVAVTAPAATVAGDGGGAEGAYYFKTSELDRRPFPLTRVEVPAPESEPSMAGAVTIRLRISESGRIDDARIMMSTGVREFEDAALREFKSAKFHPGYRASVPVRSEMLIEVTLRPEPGKAAPGILPAVAGSAGATP